MFVNVVADRPVFRFAPSPTGALHIGHVRSALIGSRMAAAWQGRFLLRIEDIDATRLNEAFVDGIFEDLSWLGLQWETPVLRQSQHMAAYAHAAQRLKALGLLYPCFATRTELATVADRSVCDPDGAPHYPGLWRHRTAADIVAAESAGRPKAWRLDMTKALAETTARGLWPLAYTAFDAADLATDVRCDPARWGDVVLVRKETPTSYHLSVVVDDARQGVTHVTRGADLLAATDLHRLLQALLGLPAPRYHHHRLITDAMGQKLSKSAGAASIRSLREAGYGAQDIIAQALDGL